MWQSYFRQSCGQAAANCLGACALRAPFAFRDWVASHLEAKFGSVLVAQWHSFAHRAGIHGPNDHLLGIAEAECWSTGILLEVGGIQGFWRNLVLAAWLYDGELMNSVEHWEARSRGTSQQNITGSIEARFLTALGFLMPTAYSPRGIGDAFGFEFRSGLPKTRGRRNV